MKTIIVAAAALTITACTNERHATKVLERSGYTEVQMTGYRMLDCGKGDNVHDGFRAKGPTGVPVTGVVCCGLIAKNCTVRLD